MSPVIQNIVLKKQNDQSGANRKIALVLYGGIMLGVRGAGALDSFQKNFGNEVFDSIYTMSSGFLNASYFLSGQIGDALEIYINDVSEKKFIDPWRFWKVADLDYLISVIENKKPLNTRKILENPTKLFLMLINVKTKEPEYLEAHSVSADKYIDLMRAASSLPFIGWGVTEIGGEKYRDILADDNIPKLLEHVLESDATDILILYNYPWQKKYVNEKLDLNKEGERVCEIELWNNENMSRFETDPTKLSEAAEFAKNKILEIFKN